VNRVAFFFITTIIIVIIVIVVIVVVYLVCFIASGTVVILLLFFLPASVVSLGFSLSWWWCIHRVWAIQLCFADDGFPPHSTLVSHSHFCL